jgi:hypothetical protein
MSKTNAYTVLELSQSAYDEIKQKMKSAGCDHAFIQNPFAPSSPRIVMQGIAVVPEDEITVKAP